MIYTLFRTSTGLPVAHVTCAEDQIEQNTPSDCIAVSGMFDLYRTQLVDGEVTAYQPPPPEPSEDYEWSDERGWVLTENAAQRRHVIAEAHRRISELEKKQERAVREYLLGLTPSEEDVAAGALTLQEIEDAIAAQRAIIRANS